MILKQNIYYIVDFNKNDGTDLELYFTYTYSKKSKSIVECSLCMSPQQPQKKCDKRTNLFTCKYSKLISFSGTYFTLLYS